MSDRANYLAAVARAEANKAQFMHNAEALKDRISPSRLKADAKAGVKKVVRDTKARSRATLRQHPVVVGIIGAGLFAFLLRRPLAAILRRLTARKTEPAPPPQVDDTPPIVTAPPVPTPAHDPAIAAPAAPPEPETSDEE